MKKSILSITIAALLGLGVVSCREQKSDSEKAADEVEETMEDTGDAIEDAADDAGDAMEDAYDDVEDAAEDTKDDMQLKTTLSFYEKLILLKSISFFYSEQKNIVIPISLLNTV